MTNGDQPPPPPTLTLVEKLYAVHNINNLIHCNNFGVLKHIQSAPISSSTPPPPTDEWLTVDSIVKSWIFLTLAPTLQRRLIKANHPTAKDAWDQVEKNFLDNKRTRIIALKGELRVIQMGDLSVNAYFHKIESIVTLLNDIGSSMTDDDIVTYAINDPFPDLETMRSMVTTEEMRLNSKSSSLSTNTTSSAPRILLTEINNSRGQDSHNNRDSRNNTRNFKQQDANIVRSTWLFRHKHNADGSLSRYKARLVANGSTQLTCIDVDETFSPVVKPATIRTVLSLAISRHWHVHQLNFKNVFLHGLYRLLRLDFRVLTASSSTLLQHVIGSLHAEFSMTDLGPLNYFLGISVTRNTSEMFLSQSKYATEVLERANMLDCNPCRTLVDTYTKLAADGDLVFDPTLYRILAGALQYLTFTRLDISYVVQQICIFMHDPRESHFSALKRILRYVRGTLDYGLQLYSSSTSSLVAYLDADLAGYPTTRRSTSGYCVFLGNNLLSWSSKRQFTLSRSSVEAEYREVANAVAETCWLRNLLRELYTPLLTATIVYCGNVSVVYLSFNPLQHQLTKHIEIGIHFVRDLVTTGHVCVLHVPFRY
ncbi:ribonuclease H-like domain-containing protein [Tanacetum coccineum]